MLFDTFERVEIPVLVLYIVDTTFFWAIVFSVFIDFGVFVEFLVRKEWIKIRYFKTNPRKFDFLNKLYCFLIRDTYTNMVIKIS